MSAKLNDMNVGSNNARVAFFETYLNLITGHINSDSAISFIDYSFGMYNDHDTRAASYDHIFESQDSLNPSSITLRSGGYYSGRGALFTERGNLIWTLAVRKSHVKYAKLCYLLGKPMDPKALVFISQTNFDNKSTFNKPLRTAFRKHMKGWLVENEVAIVEMDFNDLFCGRVTVPEDVSSIKDIKAWQSDLIVEFAEGYRVESALSEAGVELAF